MAQWLVKSDPDEYSAADLERDGSTDWTGVRNALAQIHLRGMAVRDRVLIYHTGDEKAIVATATVATKPRPDKSDETGKSMCVGLRFDAWLTTPVTLATLKADSRFKSLDLVRVSRLSVMPVSDDHWQLLISLSGGEKARK